MKIFTQSLAGTRNVFTNSVKMLVILLITAIIGEVMLIFGLTGQVIIMLYLLAIQVISAVTPDYIYGIMSAIIGTLIYDYIITDPRMGFSFTIGLPVTMFIMLLATVIASAITARIKKEALIAFEREQRTQQLYEINQKLLAARSLDTITSLTEEYLTSHLHRPTILYTHDQSAPDSIYHKASNIVDEQAVPLYTNEQKRLVLDMFKNSGQESDQALKKSDSSVLHIPVISKKFVLGVICIACKGNPVNQGELTFVRMISGQVALALELQYLSDEQARILVESEKEKTRGTLLRSVSHDLRTPLTGILGASSTILEQKSLDHSTLENLVKDIHQNAQWLIRMVENILIITRISGDNIKIKKVSEAAEEVVSGAVSIVRKRFPDHTFHVHIPDELLLVPMDGTLISQVLINLLENAAKNSPDESLIILDLEEKDGYAKFDVVDNGHSIPEHLLDDLFGVHSVVADQAMDTSRGTGLGLSICKTIVQIHGGTIEGRNSGKRGAIFSFKLPLQEAMKGNE